MEMEAAWRGRKGRRMGCSVLLYKGGDGSGGRKFAAGFQWGPPFGRTIRYNAAIAAACRRPLSLLPDLMRLGCAAAGFPERWENSLPTADFEVW